MMSEEEEEGPTHVWEMLLQRDHGRPENAGKAGPSATSMPSLGEGGTRRRYIDTCRVHEMQRPEWVGPLVSPSSFASPISSPHYRTSPSLLTPTTPTNHRLEPSGLAS